MAIGSVASVPQAGRKAEVTGRTQTATNAASDHQASPNQDQAQRERGGRDFCCDGNGCKSFVTAKQRGGANECQKDAEENEQQAENRSDSGA